MSGKGDNLNLKQEKNRKLKNEKKGGKEGKNDGGRLENAGVA